MARNEITPEETVLLQWLREEEGPVSPRQLLERQRPAGISSLGLRSALWRLVDRGAAQFTPDRKLEPTVRGATA